MGMGAKTHVRDYHNIVIPGFSMINVLVSLAYLQVLQNEKSQVKGLL